MPTYEDELIGRARELQRLATKRRRLRAQLKQLDQEIRHTRKAINAIKQASEDRRPDIAPMRLTAGVTGIPMPRGDES
jgi:phage shock protein A